jgi:Rrf2 family transcriptional regulator, iron-sulfur cluster assembly transcription factor
MLTRTGDYAIKATMFLAAMPEGNFAGASEIARSINVPANYLGKLLRRLAEAGILKSRKGHGGGFKLARKAGRISLMSLMEPVEDLSFLSGCMFDSTHKCGYADKCPVHDTWGEIRERLITVLEKTTLQHLMTP